MSESPSEVLTTPVGDDQTAKVDFLAEIVGDDSEFDKLVLKQSNKIATEFITACGADTGDPAFATLENAAKKFFYLFVDPQFNHTLASRQILAVFISYGRFYGGDVQAATRAIDRAADSMTEYLGFAA